ncbi:GNAT family N-acetyltransferase [Cytobacillus sp. NJ13]|nr:GNAT family N-acetyltransferase [Cytobacillus sp. NJ13]
MESLENAVTFNELKWDTDFFGVTSAKATLHCPLTLDEWEELKTRFKDYQFVSIINKNSEPINSQLIGKNTSAFLTDVNIQFVKKLGGPQEIPANVTMHQSLGRDNQIIEIADFKFSKFTEDPELAKRKGDQVYRQWLFNAFDKPDKFFALSRDENEGINGFVLYSFSDNVNVIELIAVSPLVTKGGIGTSLFKAVEYATHQHGYNEIKVGTQMRNMGAINFYQKVGCKQIGCHQVYHLWNL